MATQFKNKTKRNNRTRSVRSSNNKSSNNKSSNNKSLSSLQKQITIMFMEMLMMVKLYHWKTHSYATHKATDDLYSKLNENVDKFMEVLLGKSGERTNLTGQKQIRLMDLTSQEELKREVYSFKGYLVALNDNAAIKQMTNTDLLNIRDEILGDLNQFLYLLSFK